MSISWLIGVAMYCSDYHDGQWSRLYRLGCIARDRLKRDHQITDLFVWLESPAINKKYREQAENVYRRLSVSM